MEMEVIGTIFVLTAFVVGMFVVIAAALDEYNDINNRNEGAY